MQIQSLTGAWQFRQAGASQRGDDEWLPATVPGGAHTDLLALGRIPDPFVGDNERRVAWVAEADWEYRYQFAVTPEILRQPHIWLVCDGLDTLATVTLNGHVLGSTANMFRQYRWDVKPLLKAEGNELRIEFASVVNYAAQQEAIRHLPGVSQAIPGGPHVRKAPCQFGWDWGPQLPPVGIWKDIRLEGYGVRGWRMSICGSTMTGERLRLRLRLRSRIWGGFGSVGAGRDHHGAGWFADRKDL